MVMNKSLVKKLLEAQLLTQEQLEAIQNDAARTKKSWLACLAEGPADTDTQAVALLISQTFGVPFLDLKAFDLSYIPQQFLNDATSRKFHCLPLLQRDKTLFVAAADPMNAELLDQLKFQSGLTIETVVVDIRVLQTVLTTLFRTMNTVLTVSDLENIESLNIAPVAEESLQGDDAAHADDAPVVRYVNQVLLDAINRGASDIHFEPYEKMYRIRIRRDGVLQELSRPPSNVGPRLVARIKVIARLDISERRLPQDGRFKMKLDATRSIDFRVSTCPTLFGEKAVIRVLDPANAQIGIDGLGYDPDQKTMFLKAIHRPQGMVLVTGPTGSGKTVSLYTALNILNTDEVNISTAEDPVEINLPGINQVNVSPKVGLTFAAALRSFLRQDPDIVMVGEIRDLETAEIAVKAAQTGHMVLSTLHTNSAPETVSRLMNMGIEPFNLATSLSLVVAQRLARRLCTECREEEKLSTEALVQAGFPEEEHPDLTLYAAHPKGCDQCNHGYKGRLGLYEVMPITPALSTLIMEGGNALHLAQQAKEEGIANLYQSGLRKVRQGLTSLTEVLRVTKD